MRAIKFTMVDILKCKFQLIFLIIFALVAYMIMEGQPMIGLIYMEFAAIIISAQPFMQEQVAESGFINMLPLTKRQRVGGRYIFGAFLILAGTLIGFLVLCISLRGEEMPAYFVPLTMLSAGIGLLVIGIQYTLFYLMGKFKSQQMAGIVMMLPGFVMFFGSQAIASYAIDIPAMYSWLMNHIALVGAGGLAAGLIIWFLGIQISAVIVEKRDMN